MERTLCTQHAEASLNTRLSNHRNYIKISHPKNRLACKHFQEENNKNFTKHPKLTIIDKLTNTIISAKTLN